MKENFEKAINFVLNWEGGYSDDPQDTGGVTIYGIAKKYHPQEVEQMEQLWKQGRQDECKEIAKKIYKSEYWDKIGGDEFPYPRDIIMFDTAVNMGIGTAFSLNKKAPDNWKDYLIERIKLYRDYSKKNQRFLLGWLNRCLDLYDLITKNKF